MSQLTGFVSSIINSFLGPNKSNKFLIQDNDVYITRCPLVIFQNVHFQNPVSSLVEETLSAHHDLYGCSTISLLAMWYLWNEEFRLAVDEGCEIQDIIRHSQNLLEKVISAVSEITIKFETMFPKRQNLPRKTHKTLGIFHQVPISIQYSSRHFSPAANCSDVESDGKFDEHFEMDEDCLKRVVQCLNHDEANEISDLLLKCWKMQTSSSGLSKFSADGILICPIVLPCSSSMVIDGLIIKSHLNYSWCHDMKNSCSNRCLILKSSLTYEYVHLGFSPKVKIHVQKSSLVSDKQKWTRNICEFIKQLNLDVLLIKDAVDPEIADFCLTHSLLVLPHIPLITFKKLCNTLQYSPSTYIVDCTEKDIIRNLTVNVWKPKDDVVLKDQYFSIAIDSETADKLQTIVLCHPCQAVLESTEHQMYHLISRLSQSFESGTLLPGDGITEKYCFEFLTNMVLFHDLSGPASRVIKALADGFRNYASMVSKKKSLSTNQESKMMDEMSSKLSAWHSALSLLLLTLQCDSVIINGAVD